MRLAVSHTFFNKKLHEFGHGHDATIIEMMNLEKQKLNEAFPVSMEETGLEKECERAGDDGCSLSEASQRIIQTTYFTY